MDWIFNEIKRYLMSSGICVIRQHVIKKLKYINLKWPISIQSDPLMNSYYSSADLYNFSYKMITLLEECTLSTFVYKVSKLQITSFTCLHKDCNAASPLQILTKISPHSNPIRASPDRPMRLRSCQMEAMPVPKANSPKMLWHSLATTGLTKVESDLVLAAPTPSNRDTNTKIHEAKPKNCVLNFRICCNFFQSFSNNTSGKSKSSSSGGKFLNLVNTYDFVTLDVTLTYRKWHED